MIKNSALLIITFAMLDVLPSRPRPRSGAHDRLHHRSSEGQYAGRPRLFSSQQE